MEKAVEDFRKELGPLRCVRGAQTLRFLDNVRVDYPARQCRESARTVTVPDATMIVSRMDTSAVAMIDKAIRTSDLGLESTNDGKVVAYTIHPLPKTRKNS